MNPEIKKYYQSKRINNSLLGMMDNPRWFKWKRDHPDTEDDEKRHFRVGSALDTLLTDNEQFHHEFKIVSTVRPFGLMGKFIDKMPYNLTMGTDPSEFQEAYESSGYRMKLETVLTKFWGNKDFVEYYESLCCEDDGRQVLSKDEFDTVINMKELILANANVLPYFMNTDKDVEIIYQMPIYFDYGGEECKGLLDLLVINHREKTIQPIDLKSTGKPVKDFRKAYLQFGYYRQAAFYTEAVKWWVQDQSEKRALAIAVSGGEDLPNLIDYELKNFIFVVVEAKLSSSEPAIIFNTTDADLYAGLNGGTTKFGKYYKGINQYLEDYLWHMETDKWEMSRSLYESGGKIVLDVF